MKSRFCSKNNEIKNKISSCAKLKPEKGAGMVDVLLGVLLLGLIGTFLMGSFRTFIIGARTAADRTQALFLAQQALEEFKKNDGAASPDWGYTPPGSKYSITSRQLDSMVIKDAGLTDRLIPRQVTVTWTTPQGTESLSLVGYYYK